MADISLTQDTFDDSDEGVYEQGDTPAGSQIDDESLPPLVRIQKYAHSDNIHDRLMVWKVLTDLFRTGPPDLMTAYLPHIMSVVSKLADEGNKIVRKGLIDQIPNLAVLAKECSSRIPALKTVVSEYFLPMIVRNLGTDEHFSRKAAETSLFALMDHGHISRMEAEIQVCPTVLALSREESSTDDHLLAVTLMSKLATLLGKHTTERVFLDRFAERCKNSAFYVRKTCASHIGDFCTVVSKDACEKILLPCYIGLCSDEMWAVRKTCAEVAVTVSCAMPSTVRTEMLAPVFTKLLQDENRCVRMSAFLTLGPFISTFGNSVISGLFYSEGDLMSLDSEGREYRVIQPCAVGKTYNYKFTDMNFKEEDFMYESTEDFVEQMFGKMPDKTDTGISLDIPNLAGTPLDILEQQRKREDLIIQKNMEIASKAIFKEENVNKMHSTLEEENEAAAYETPKEDSENFKEIVETVKNALLSFRVLPDDEQKSDDEPCNKKCDSDVEKSSEIAKVTEMCDVDLSRSSSSGVSSLDNISSLKNSNSNATILSSPDTMRTDFTEGGAFNEVGEDKENKPKTPTGEEDGLHQYNSYNYWYIRPELPVDLSIVNGANSPKKKDEGNADKSIKKETEDNKLTTMTADNTTVTGSQESIDTLQTDKDVNAKPNEGSSEETTVDENATWDGVPQSLITHFVSMTSPSLAQEIDNDMALHCAYSLPAVALTLGSKHWHLLKDTVEALAASMHYKVRRTIAMSLHELALILGPEITTNYLTSIFEGFIKDLDEVRIGILKHMTTFLQQVNPSKRDTYLPRFADFLQSDNELNWRYREELATQLRLSMSLFRPAETAKHVPSIAQILLSDRIDAVRKSTFCLITDLLKYMASERNLTMKLLIVLAERFAHAKKWKRRQTFALLCSEILAENAITMELFVSDMMPHLVDLSWDPVANVRMVVARTISKQLIGHPYFSDPNNQHYDNLETVLRRLQADKDQDVRNSALVENFTNFLIHKQKKVKTT